MAKMPRVRFREFFFTAAFAITAILQSAQVQAQQQPPETTGAPQKKAGEIQKPAPAPAIEKPEQAKPSGAEEKKIVVTRFEFSGNTLFSSDQLAAQITGYTNHPVSLLEIYEAADKVTDFYVQHGYTLASTAVPAQRIAGGVVKLEVIEGRVGKVEMEGTHRYTAEDVSPYLGEFKSGQIYKGTSLEDGLLRVNRLPGLQAKAVLRPGDQFGTSDLLIQASEQTYGFSLIGDNYGRQNIGEYRTSIAGQFNNPLRFEDQIQALYLHSEANQLNYGFLGYSIPVGHSGARASANYGQADFSATAAGGILVNGKNKNGRVGLDWPLTLTRDDQFVAGAAVTRQLANSDIAGTVLPGATNITLFELSGYYNHTYTTLAVSQLLATLSTNFNKATASSCRPFPVDCNDQLVRLELDAQHLQPIIDRLDSYIHVNGVYSPDPLPPATPFSLGGPNNVRGYPASEVRGDRGVFASAGLRQGFTAGPVQLAARAFVDSGTARYVSPTPPLALPKATLSSIGMGGDVAWKVTDFNLSAKLEWSVPVGGQPAGSPSDGEGGSRLFGTLTVGY